MDGWMDGWSDVINWMERNKKKTKTWWCGHAVGPRERRSAFICIPMRTFPAFISSPPPPGLERAPYLWRVGGGGGDFVFCFSLQLFLWGVLYRCQLSSVSFFIFFQPALFSSASGLKTLTAVRRDALDVTDVPYRIGAADRKPGWQFRRLTFA